MAQTPKNPQQSQLQNSPPERKPHFSDRRQTQNHHTPRKHQKRHATRNHTTSRVNKRRISETTGLKKHHDNITKITSPSLNKKKKRIVNKTTNTTHKPSLSNHTTFKVSHEYIVQTPPENPTPQAIGSRRLSWSTEVFQLTPQLHQTHLLWEPSSPKGEWLPIFGRGFGLRCFQPLSSMAWLPGICPIGQPVN